MSQEALANQLESADDPQQRSERVNTLLSQYRSALVESGLPKVDVEHSLRKLGEKPPSELNPEHLRANLEYIKSPEAKEKVKKQTEAYAGIIDNLIKEELFSTDPAAKALYIKWLLDEPFDKREDIIKQPFYKLEDRKKAKKAWERIPKAERAANPQYSKLGVEERLALVEKLGKKHEELKNAFHKLPEKLQEKHWKEFKELNLRDREAFLKTLKNVDGKEEGAAEGKETDEAKEVKEFETKTATMVKDDLLTDSSRRAYNLWFKNLTLQEMRNMQKNSELDTRMGERKNARDTFNDLSAEVRRPREAEFRMADVDKRKQILAQITGARNAANNDKTSYPDAVLETTLKKTLHDPTLHEQRSVFTLVDTMYTLNRRESLVDNTRSTDTMVEKAEERGAEIDDGEDIIVQELAMHQDERFGLKRRLIESNKLATNPNARHNNATLRNMRREVVSADQFRDEVVNPQREELLARVVEMSMRRLPRANKVAVERAARKMDLHLDMHKEAA